MHPSETPPPIIDHQVTLSGSAEPQRIVISVSASGRKWTLNGRTFKQHFAVKMAALLALRAAQGKALVPRDEVSYHTLHKDSSGLAPETMRRWVGMIDDIVPGAIVLTALANGPLTLRHDLRDSVVFERDGAPLPLAEVERALAGNWPFEPTRSNPIKTAPQGGWPTAEVFARLVELNARIAGESLPDIYRERRAFIVQALSDAEREGTAVTHGLFPAMLASIRDAEEMEQWSAMTADLGLLTRLSVVEPNVEQRRLIDAHRELGEARLRYYKSPTFAVPLRLLASVSDEVLLRDPAFGANVCKFKALLLRRAARAQADDLVLRARRVGGDVTAIPQIDDELPRFLGGTPRDALAEALASADAAISMAITARDSGLVHRSAAIAVFVLTTYLEMQHENTGEDAPFNAEDLANTYAALQVRLRTMLVTAGDASHRSRAWTRLYLLRLMRVAPNFDFAEVASYSKSFLKGDAKELVDLLINTPTPGNAAVLAEDTVILVPKLTKWLDKPLLSKSDGGVKLTVSDDRTALRPLLLAESAWHLAVGTATQRMYCSHSLTLLESPEYVAVTRDRGYIQSVIDMCRQRLNETMMNERRPKPAELAE